MPTRKPTSPTKPTPAQSADAPLPDFPPDELELSFTPEAIPADEQVARFTLDRPPARLSGMRRAAQKPMIQRAHALIASGRTAHEALTMALAGE